MAKFGITASEFEQLIKDNPRKLFQHLQRSTEDHDYDSGIVAKPSGGVFNHRLGIAPKTVWVLGYSAQNGASYVQENASAVTSTTITVGGSQPFYRVLANR